MDAPSASHEVFHEHRARKIDGEDDVVGDFFHPFQPGDFIRASQREDCQNETAPKQDSCPPALLRKEASTRTRWRRRMLSTFRSKAASEPRSKRNKEKHEQPEEIDRKSVV